MIDPAVLIVEDDADLRNALCHTLEDGEYPVITASNGNDALAILESESIGLVVSDIQMEPMNGRELLERIRREHPTMPAVLMTAFGTIENAVDVMRAGAADYLAKPFAADELIKTVNRFMQEYADTDHPVAIDRKSKDILHTAARVAKSNATVTLSGESGTGKEVFARYIHRNSLRRDNPYVAINCAAIPENMLEAVLFGHEKGAFTGASNSYAGKFEQANTGTLLLDEISEMDLGLQAKILRVLQEREVERIGGRKTIPVDLRILATTNRDLRQHVSNGHFREDLFYRLNVFPLVIPPLRERKRDILPLARLAVLRCREGDRSAPGITACAEKALVAHQWPGNVRELENVVQRSMILLDGDKITAADLVFEDAGSLEITADYSGGELHGDLLKSEFQMIVSALDECAGNRRQTAERLGISPRTLRYKLAKMRDAGLTLHSNSASIAH